jgi:hypothetical protein
MFRSLLLVMLSVLAASSSVWAQPQQVVDGREQARVCTATRNGQLLLDSDGRKRVLVLVDSRDRAQLVRVDKHRWFWDVPTWQPPTW